MLGLMSHFVEATDLLCKAGFSFRPKREFISKRLDKTIMFP